MDGQQQGMSLPYPVLAYRPLGTARPKQYRTVGVKGHY
jgi:hypothetical protein